MALVTFCFGSVFGMVTVKMQLNNGCQQRVQVAAKGYEQPNHEGDEQEKKDEDDG